MTKAVAKAVATQPPIESSRAPSYAAQIWLAEGQIRLALPPSAGASHESFVWLPDTPAGHEALRALLRQREMAQTAGPLGAQGTPTQAELTHNRKHAVWPDDRCPWCRELKRLGKKEPPRADATGWM